MPQQIYEDYWSLTLAYTNYNGEKFLKTLEICIEFIDEFKPIHYSEAVYKVLNDRILASIPKYGSDPDASTRKAINQLVKLGFIESLLTGYHINAKDYLNARTNKRRQTLLSKIVYSNSKFNSSVTHPHNWSQIKFLLKTLEEVEFLSEIDIIALMTINIEEVEKGFVTRDEINVAIIYATETGFIGRKYNQIDYLKNILGKLDDIVFIKRNGAYELYFTEDAKRIFGEDLLEESLRRNPYLHLLYKNQLFEESEEKYGGRRICMLEKLSYPVLIASHIKPFRDSEENQRYDPDNGLLLSRTIDSLFDLLYISFHDDGSIIFSERLSPDVKEFWEDYKLEPEILNEQRKTYLAYHRNLFTERDARIIV
jgi:hypothetical protein